MIVNLRNTTNTGQTGNFARCCKTLQFIQISQPLVIQSSGNEILYCWVLETCLFCLGTQGYFRLLVLLHDALNLIGCRQRHSLLKFLKNCIRIIILSMLSIKGNSLPWRGYSILFTFWKLFSWLWKPFSTLKNFCGGPFRPP